MSIFFTHKKAINNFLNYGPMHILLIIIAIFFIIYSIKKSKSEFFEKLLIYILFFSQIILLIWYFTGDEFISEGLPLYTCRIAGFSLSFSYFFKNDFLKSLGTYLGFIGGITSILSPALYEYSMLHFTNINFFLFHISLLSLSSYYIVNYKNVILKNKFKCQISILLILIAINIINVLLKSNYAYTISPPILISFYEKISPVTYFIIITFLYEFSIFLESIIIKKIKPIY